jgi:hypothetical protein
MTTTQKANHRFVHVEIDLLARTPMEAALAKQLTQRLDQDVSQFWHYANWETRHLLVLLLERIGDPEDGQPESQTVDEFLATLRNFLKEMEAGQPTEPASSDPDTALVQRLAARLRESTFTPESVAQEMIQWLNKRERAAAMPAAQRQPERELTTC